MQPFHLVSPHINHFPAQKIQGSQEHPFLKELKEQNISEEELQEWRKVVRKDREAKRRKLQTTHPELNLIVLGLAGMGKSTLLNSLLQQEAFSTGSTEQSSGVTKRMSSGEGICGDFVLKAIDTPGFGDSTVSPKNWCIQLYFNAYQKQVDLLFFVLRADLHKVGRWNLILAKFMALFIKDDAEGNPGKNIVLVFTHTDKLSLKEKNELEQKCEKIKEQFNETINKSWKIEKIFYFAKDQIDDIRKIYKYALENRKEKKLGLQLPNLTLVKNILKEEFGDFGAQSPQRLREKKNEREKEKDAVEEEFGNVGKQSPQRLREKKNERKKEKDTIEEEFGDIEEQSSEKSRDDENENEKEEGAVEEEFGNAEEQSSERSRDDENKNEKEEGAVEEEFGNAEKQSSERSKNNQNKTEKGAIEEEFGDVEEQNSEKLREKRSEREKEKDAVEEDFGDVEEQNSERSRDHENEKEEEGALKEEFGNAEEQSSERLKNNQNEKEQDKKVYKDLSRPQVERKKEKSKKNNCFRLTIFGN